MEKITKQPPLDILRMLENLHDVAVERPRTVVGPLVWGLNKEEVAMQIAKIRASLPSELKQAVTLTRESEKIVASAREDALMTTERAKREAERILEEARQESHRILEQSRLQQQQLIADNEILKMAKQTGEEIRSMAEREASQIRRGAENYAYDVLTHLESVVGKIMATVERGKTEIQPASEAPSGDQRQKVLA